MAELNERIVGFTERENRAWQRAARLVSLILTALCGKWIKAESILPEVFPGTIVLLSDEEKQKELNEIKEQVGLLN